VTSKVEVTGPLWVAVQITTCRGAGHIMAAALQAAQLDVVVVVVIIII